MNRRCVLILNAHVPWVRHPDTADAPQEKWVFDSLLDCYLPVLAQLIKLREEGVRFRLGMALSPTLGAMLRDPVMRKRADIYLDRATNWAHAVLERGGSMEERRLASDTVEHYGAVGQFYRRILNRDLVGALELLQESGQLEMMATAATHGLLPLLLKVPEAVRAQVLAGCRWHEKTFGAKPRGFWLPECAYSPPLDPILAEAGVEWTVLEDHSILQCKNPPRTGINRPVRSKSGLRLFGREPGLDVPIRDYQKGFPADPRYRKFRFNSPGELRPPAPNDYARVEIAVLSGKNRAPQDTQGRPEVVQPDYDPEQAAKAVREHAAQFIETLAAHLQRLEDFGIPEPVAVCAMDIDHLGRWWFEGPEFLATVFRMAAARNDFSFVTPAEVLAGKRYGGDDTIEPIASSWGGDGYFGKWLGEDNAWIYPHLYQRASQVTHFQSILDESGPSLLEETLAYREECLSQMARELLLAQSSDWAALMNDGATREFANQQVKNYLGNFDRVWKMFASNSPEAADALRKIKAMNPIFPDLDPSWYSPRPR